MRKPPTSESSLLELFYQLAFRGDGHGFGMASEGRNGPQRSTFEKARAWLAAGFRGGALVVGMLLAMPATPGRAAVSGQLEYTFAVPPANPIGELVQGTDGNFYGTTSEGGAGGCGTVFKMTAAGVITTLVEFTGNGDGNKGAFPAAALIQASNGSFYGTTAKGGAGGWGTIFKMTADGALTTFVEFTNDGATNRGAAPYAALLEANDGNLYGTTSKGGLGFGTVFSITPDGTFTTLVEFTSKGATNQGANPYAALIQANDGLLYGTTAKGGIRGTGTIFSMNTSGALTTLTHFTDGIAVGGINNRGASPYGALIEGFGGVFYGTTSQGGTGEFGTVYKVSTAGVLQTMAEFTGSTGARRGAAPESALVPVSDGSLYGTTFGGGANNAGTIFNITKSGALTTVFDFTGNGSVNKGAVPQSGLIRASDGKYYGVTFRGGAKNAGTVFKFAVGNALNTLVEFAAPNPAAYAQAALVMGPDGNFYGTRGDNGINGKGTIFRMSPDGVVMTLVEFTDNGATNRGANPYAALIVGSDTNFYGTTAAGGAGGFGTIFRMTSAGVLTTLVELTSNGATKKGAIPASALVEGADGNFYGTTAKGGAHDLGTVFKMTPAGVLTTLVEFTGNGATNKGSAPFGTLVQWTDGNFYGTTSIGGSNNYGTVFKMTPDGTLTTLAEFADNKATVDGARPYAGLVLGSDNNFYGATATGGATGDGTVFKVTPAGVVTTLVELTGKAGPNKGTYPQGSLFPGSDGMFYGTTGFGGAPGYGTAFRISPSGVFNTLVEFSGNGAANKGSAPYAALVAGTDGNYYGTTSGGGAQGAGTIFSLQIRAAATTQSAVDVQTDGVTLSATVKPGGLTASAYFEYGTTTGYGSTTASQAIGNGAGSVTLTAALSGLAPNTTYHYRVVITDSSGTIHSEDRTFTTEPLATTVIASGDVVTGEPIASFGVPTIDDNQGVVVVANLTAAGGADAAILAGNPPVVLVRKSQLAPKPDGATSNTRVFTTFGNPVSDKTGEIAFSATILDGTATGSGLWTNALGALREVALVGGPVAGVSGAKFKAITSYALSGSGELFYVATIAGGGVNATSNLGLWACDAGGSHLLLRTNDPLNGSNVSSFNVLNTVAGSPGQGRAYQDGIISVRVSLIDTTQAIVNFSPGTVPEIVASTGDRVDDLPVGNRLLNFGIPTVSAAGTSAFLGTLFTGPGGVTAATNQVIVADSSTANLAVVARKGDFAEAAGGASYAALANPVYNAQANTAFLSTLAGPGVTPANNTGIWWTTPSGIKLVARAGGEPVGVPGATWASFTSLALPDQAGPVFMAKLAAGAGGTVPPAGVGVTNNTGVWAIDSTGALRLIVRTGDILHVNGQAKTLSLMTFLNSVTGSAGQGRSYNHNQDLVFRATFTDHTQAVMKIHVP